MAPSKIPVPLSWHKRANADSSCHSSTHPLIPKHSTRSALPSTSISDEKEKLYKKEQQYPHHHKQQRQQQQAEQLLKKSQQNDRQNQERLHPTHGNVIKPHALIINEAWRRTRSLSDSASPTSSSSSLSLLTPSTLSPSTATASKWQSSNLIFSELLAAGSSSLQLGRSSGGIIDHGLQSAEEETDRKVFKQRTRGVSGGFNQSNNYIDIVTGSRAGKNPKGKEDESSPTTPVPGSCIFLDNAVSSDRGVGGMATSIRGLESTTESEAADITLTPATVRKYQSTHVYFLDYYIDLLSYLKNRQERLQAFKKDLHRQNELSAEESEQAWTEFRMQEQMILRQRRTRTQAIQFKILTQVGQGGFGEVFLARKADTSELCALKRMSKKHLHLQDEVQHILTERDVLTATKSEWHVKLLYSFQDTEYVYLAMEFVQGGDVRTMLTARGVLKEEDSKLYFAEMMMAIDALHQQGYIHRDLKPENFLIDQTGHIKLTDFGLSKGQLAESRIEAMKTKLREVKNSMEPTMPVLRRGGSSMIMPLHHQHLNQHHHQRSMGGEGVGLEGSLGVRLGGAGGSFANLNGILHRSPSHMIWNGSSSNLTNNSLLNLSAGVPQQQGTPEYKNEGIRRAFSIVGSADYMAPEILTNKGYDYGVDYWSLGCILFEFLCGYSPFQAEDTRQTCVNVWHWRKVLQRPIYDTEENLEFNLTDEAWDLITCLIADRDERYTTLQRVQEHPWLAGLDWNNLRSMPASFVPVLSTPIDTSYFDDFSNPDDMMGYKDVKLRQAQVQEAEAAADANAGSLAGQGSLQDQDFCSGSNSSLPQILRVQDPWKGAFVGFTFRHHE